MKEERNTRTEEAEERSNEGKRETGLGRMIILQSHVVPVVLCGGGVKAKTDRETDTGVI